MRERAAAIADASAAEYRAFAAEAEAKGFYSLAGEQHGAANDAERLAVLIRALPLEE